MLLTLARWTQPNFVDRAVKNKRAELLTIPYSHYCETAAWSLQLARIPFVERDFMPGEHVLPLLALRVTGDSKFISKSSFVTRVDGKGMAEQDSKIQRYKRSTAVPALCTADGEVLKDSWEIAAYSGLPGMPSKEYMEFYDAELGPSARQFAYNIILKTKHRRIWDNLVTADGSWLWKVVYYFLGNSLWKRMRLLFAVDKPDVVQNNYEKLLKIFDQIRDERLQKVTEIAKTGKESFVHGNSLSVEDIAICSLAGPALFVPDLYCKGRFTRWFNCALSADADAQKKVDTFRSHAVGQFVMRVYEKYRLQPS